MATHMAFPVCLRRFHACCRSAAIRLRLQGICSPNNCSYHRDTCKTIIQTPVPSSSSLDLQSSVPVPVHVHSTYQRLPKTPLARYTVVVGPSCYRIMIVLLLSGFTAVSTSCVYVSSTSGYHTLRYPHLLTPYFILVGLLAPAHILQGYR